MLQRLKLSIPRGNGRTITTIDGGVVSKHKRRLDLGPQTSTPARASSQLAANTAHPNTTRILANSGNVPVLGAVVGAPVNEQFNAGRSGSNEKSNRASGAGSYRTGSGGGNHYLADVINDGAAKAVIRTSNGGEESAFTAISAAAFDNTDAFNRRGSNEGDYRVADGVAGGAAGGYRTTSEYVPPPHRGDSRRASAATVNSNGIYKIVCICISVYTCIS